MHGLNKYCMYSSSREKLPFLSSLKEKRSPESGWERFQGGLPLTGQAWNCMSDSYTGVWRSSQALRRLKFIGDLYTSINPEIIKYKGLVKVLMSLLFLNRYQVLNRRKLSKNIQSHIPSYTQNQKWTTMVCLSETSEYHQIIKCFLSLSRR